MWDEWGDVLLVDGWSLDVLLMGNAGSQCEGLRLVKQSRKGITCL